MKSKRLKELLEGFKEKLEEETKLLINPKSPEEIEKIVEDKRKLLVEIAKFNKEDFKGLEPILEEIDILSKKNMMLAANYVEMINELFDAFFGEEKVEQYNPYGEIESKQEGGFLNKKI